MEAAAAGWAAPVVWAAAAGWAAAAAGWAAAAEDLVMGAVADRGSVAAVD